MSSHCRINPREVQECAKKFAKVGFNKETETMTMNYIYIMNTQNLCES